MATLVLEHSEVSRSNRLGAVLRDHGHKLDIRRLHRGEDVPTDLEGIDAIVVLGGPHRPDDDEQPWMAPELALLRAAHESEIPIFGICLGSQLLARALGGEIAKLDGGLEFGWHEVMLTPAGREDPLFAGIPWTSMQLHHHRYHIATLPPGARVLAKSEKTPVQAWSMGLRTYAVQYHPEAYADTLRTWMDDEPEVFDESGQTRDEVERGIDAHDADHERLAQRLFERIALCLMPLDRRFAGIAKAVHH